MCADDFLRQELADKMSKCQYAVPFILPSADEIGDESQNQILDWGLQTICKTYCKGNKPESSVTKTMAKVDCPLVSCLHLGDTVPGKSKILNEMLGRNLSNFWHEGLEGGERIQKVSQGMVEVSWHLPGNRASDKFNTPVTFTNLRGDAEKYPILTEKLSKSATITCVFTKTITKNNIYSFLEKTFGQGSSNRIIVVVLYKKDEKDKIERRMKRLEKSLTKTLKLTGHTVISHPFEENQFYNTHKKLHETLQTYINNISNGGKSLSSLVNELKSTMKVDDKKCYDGYRAA